MSDFITHAWHDIKAIPEIGTRFIHEVAGDPKKKGLWGKVGYRVSMSFANGAAGAFVGAGTALAFTAVASGALVTLPVLTYAALAVGGAWLATRLIFGENSAHHIRQMTYYGAAVGLASSALLGYAGAAEGVREIFGCVAGGFAACYRFSFPFYRGTPKHFDRRTAIRASVAAMSLTR